MTIFFAHTRRTWLLCLAVLLTLLPLQRTLAGADHDHEHDHDGEHRTQVQMSAALAAKSGITTAIAAAGELVQTRLLYGRLQADPRLVSQVQARFPGPIVRLNHTLGDTVKAGEVLAEVEANESLRRYSLVAPISGTVVAVHANVGEFASEQPLLTIANHDRLWAEFRLYGVDKTDVALNQGVRIQIGARSLDSRIERLLPPSGNEPYARALAPVDNSKGQWTPGQVVEANLVLSARTVLLLVDNRALQQIESDTVVFVQQGDTYESRSLHLGRSNGRVTEVLSGLNVGDRYVVGNSYLLKADLAKSGAAHDH